MTIQVCKNPQQICFLSSVMLLKMRFLSNNFDLKLKNCMIFYQLKECRIAYKCYSGKEMTLLHKKASVLLQMSLLYSVTKGFGLKFFAYGRVYSKKKPLNI